MYPYNESCPSEASSPQERLWFWPKSTTHGRVQANPTRQYMLSVSGRFPPRCGSSGLHRRGLHGCSGLQRSGVSTENIRVDGCGDLSAAWPRSGVGILRCPLGARWMQAVYRLSASSQTKNTTKFPVKSFKIRAWF